MKNKKENSGKTATTNKGIRLRSLSILFIVLAVAISLLFLDITYSSMSAYKKNKLANESYIDCQQRANALQMRLPLQIDQIQKFINNGDTKYLYAYMDYTNEADDSILVIEGVVRSMRSSDANSSFENLKRMYSSLCEKGCYAAALAADAYRISPDDLPKEVSGVTLEKTDAELSAQEKIDAANKLVSDDEFRDTLDDVRSGISYNLNNLIVFTQEKQAESSDILMDVLNKQRMLIAVLLGMIVLFNLLTYAIIIRPMLKAQSKIVENNRLSVSGSHEMRVLAERYNALYDQNEEQQKRLAHKASHDSLTGLKNREVFEQLCKNSDRSDSGIISMLMIDIDSFKSINDTYGHKTGDDVLRFAAKRMLDTFSDIGNVCRIGGDEFAIILKEGTEQDKELIKKRVTQLFYSLPKKQKDLPLITLSVGVAFGMQGETAYDVYKRADASLYAAKVSNDKCSLKFFDDEESIIQ